MLISTSTTAEDSNRIVVEVLVLRECRALHRGMIIITNRLRSQTARYRSVGVLKLTMSTGPSTG